MMDATDYAARLGKLLGVGVPLTWPKQGEDQMALMGAAALGLEPARRYSEKELNVALAAWLERFSRPGGLDHVTLRRYLIDFRFVDRESDGSAYWVDRDELAQEFELSVFDLKTQAIVDAVKAERAERRRQWRAAK